MGTGEPVLVSTTRMDQGRKGFRAVSCLLLALVTLSIYSRVKKNSFVEFDDQSYIVQNLHLRPGFKWQTFTWAIASTEQDNWHPLTWLSHALDYQLYGLNPIGHHSTSVLLHVLNVLLLFLLLSRVTGLPGRSLLVASLFALHPLNVESVAWAAERKNVLSTLFFLLTLGAYCRYTRNPNVKRYLAFTALFVLGLASKPMVITLPFVLLLLDFWPLQRIQALGPPPTPSLTARKNRKQQSDRRASTSAFPASQASFSHLVLEKLPLLALCVGSALITIVAQRSGGAVRSLEKFPIDVRLENAIHAYALYVWKAFWPRLALYYPHPVHTLRAWQLGLAFFFLVGVSVLVWKERFSRRYLVTGWLWYLGTLVPVIGIVQVGDQAMADRYTYIPLIGIFIMVVWRAADWADSRAVIFKVRAAVTVVILTILAILTWRQIGYWRSNYDLWSHTLEVTKTNFLAEANLGHALLVLNRPEEALPHYQAAARLRPSDPIRHVDLAVDLAECGRLQDAVEEYQTAIQSTFDDKVQARSYESLGALYSALGDYSKARESYKQALRADPEWGGGMIAHLKQSIATQPSATAYLQLGIVLERTGQMASARDAYKAALKLDPTLEEAKQSLDAMAQSSR
jgi:protein O-mannosyl-transferase